MLIAPLDGPTLVKLAREIAARTKPRFIEMCHP
jgi:hypothetical protein